MLTQGDRRRGEVGLLARLAATDKVYFDVLAAIGTVDVKRKGTVHDPLGNGGYHRIDVVQPLVEDIEALLETSGVLLVFGGRRLSLFVGQG